MPDTIVYRGKDNIYLNITNRCSCDCEFCFRSFTTGVFGNDLRLSSEPDIEDLTHEIELVFLDGPADDVAFVGMGEPTMRLDAVLAVTEWLTLRRLPSRLVTNGHGRLLNPDVDVVGELARVGLGAVTVSLNAADPADLRPALPADVLQSLPRGARLCALVRRARHRHHADRRRPARVRPRGLPGAGPGHRRVVSPACLRAAA